MNKFRPLRAPSKSLKPEDFASLKLYPYYASHKLDGIRCLIVDEVPVTRKLKTIRNDYIVEKLSGLPQLDGELILKSENGIRVPFEQVSSAVMSKHGTPNFEFSVFDCFENPNDPYLERMKFGQQYVQELNLPYVSFLNQTLVNNSLELTQYEQDCVDAGLEGAMIRTWKGEYKFGISTMNQSYLIKCKRFKDDEAIIVGFIEAMSNDNNPTIDELGFTKRSNHKDNKIPSNRLGSLICEWNGNKIQVSGFDHSTSKLIWEKQSEFLGKLIKFSYQELTAAGIPRFPQYKGIRDPDDL